MLAIGKSPQAMSEPVLEFGGEEDFAVPAARVFEVVTDLDQLPGTIPDLASSERVDEKTLRCVVRPGFSFLRGKLKMTITIDEAIAPSQATMSVLAKGIGVGIRILSRLDIADTETGSRLNWKAEVLELKGLVASVSPGLIRAAADQVIRHSWGKLRSQLEG